ncbi:hypothetical protein FBU31_002898 [Coemansia sp. 'formosensis']|nr:hypothetical protein FBU31_002898 [Coemansia sp. 'formosensis']
MEVTDASELMYDADGFPVIYPNLERLRMYDQSDFDCERIYIPDIIPFPSLKILDLNLEYPFGDDLPFRGNDIGIEYLTIYIDSKNVQVLSNSLEFEKQCKSLKKVTVYEHPRLSDLKSIMPADMTKFIRKLL